MNNEQQRDNIVSAAYKDLANERTPEHLDQRVLAMAAGSAKDPSYSRWISWARPVAWAATITLCLAITLELARQPEVQPSVAPAPDVLPGPSTTGLVQGPFDEQQSDEARVAEDKTDAGFLSKDRDRHDLVKIEVPETAEENARRSSGDIELQQEVADSIANTAAEKASLLRSAAPQPTEPQAADQPAAAARRQAPNESVPAAPAVEEIRVRQSAVVASSPMASDADAEWMACPKERRNTAESWYECILELREAGEQAAAELEQELLVDTFPDFKLP